MISRNGTQVKEGYKWILDLLTQTQREIPELMQEEILKPGAIQIEPLRGLVQWNKLK